MRARVKGFFLPNITVFFYLQFTFSALHSSFHVRQDSCTCYLKRSNGMESILGSVWKFTLHLKFSTLYPPLSEGEKVLSSLWCLHRCILTYGFHIDTSSWNPYVEIPNGYIKHLRYGIHMYESIWLQYKSSIRISFHIVNMETILEIYVHRNPY